MHKNKDIVGSSNINLNDVDKARLNFFIKEEMNYHNSIVEKLSPLSRTIPDKIIEIAEKYKELFYVLCCNNINIRNVTNNNLPDKLKFYKNYIFTENGKLVFDELSLLILDVATINGTLPWKMRGIIAVEILDVVVNQIIDQQKKSSIEDLFYDHVVTTVTPITEGNKRHLQIPKDLISFVKENDLNKLIEQEKSGKRDKFIKIKIPYFTEELTFHAPKNNWNFITLIKKFNGDIRAHFSYEKKKYLVNRYEKNSHLPLRTKEGLELSKLNKDSNQNKNDSSQKYKLKTKPKKKDFDFNTGKILPVINH